MKGKEDGESKEWDDIFGLTELKTEQKRIEKITSKVLRELPIKR